MRRNSASGDGKPPAKSSWGLPSWFPVFEGTSSAIDEPEQESSQAANNVDAADAAGSASAASTSTADAATKHRSIRIQGLSISPRGGATSTPGTFTDNTMNGDNTDTAATAAASSITEYSSPALRSSRREPSLNTANRSAFQSNGTRTTTNGATPARSIWVPPNPQHKPLVAMRATGGIRFMDPPITEPLDNNAASDSREKRPLNSSSTTQSPKGRRRSEGIIRSSNENRICLPPQSNSRRMTVAGTSNAVTSVAPLHNAMLQHQSLIPPEPPQQRQIRARARATYGIWPVPCTRLPGRQLPESSHQDEQPSMEQPPNNAPKNESELQDEEERGVDIVDSAPPPVFDLQRYTFRVPRRIALAAETATDGPTDVRLRKFTNLPLLTASPPIEDDNVQRWVSLQEEEAGLAKQRAANEKEERRFRAIQKSNDAAGEGMSETTKQVEGFDKLALSWGKGFGTVAAGSWRCASCDIVNNGTDNKCVSCTADRPNDDLANTNGLEGSTVGTATASTTTQTLTSSANPESRFSFGGTPAPSTVAGSGFTFGGTPAPSTVSGGGFTFSAAPAPSTVPGGSFTFSAAPAPSSNASTSFTGGVNASSTIMVATRTSAPPATAGGMSFMSTQASTLGSTFSFGANNASHGNSAEEKNQEEAKLHPDEVEDALPSVSEPSVGASSATAVPTLTSHGNTASASAPFSFSTGVTRTEAPAPFSAATASKIKVKFSSDPDDGGIEVKKFRGPEDGGNNGVPDQHPPSGGHVGSSTGSSGATWTNANNTAAPTAPFFRFVGTSAPTQAPALTPNDMGTSHSVSMLGSSAASGPRDGTSQPFAFGASANNAEALAPPPAFGSNQATSFAAPSFGGAPPSAPASTAAPSMFSAPTQATSQIGFGSSAASAHATTGALNFSSAPSPAQGALMFGATPASAPPAPFSFPAPAPFSSSIAPALPAAFSSSAPIPSSSGFGSSVPAAFGLAPAAASTGFGLPTPAVPTVFGPAAPFPSPPTFGGFGSSAPTPAVSNFGSAPAPVPNAFSGPGSASTLFGSSAAVSDQGMSGFMQGADVAAFGGNASAPPGDGGFQVGTAKSLWSLSWFPVFGRTSSAIDEPEQESSQAAIDAAAVSASDAAASTSTADAATKHRSIQIQGLSISPRGGATSTPFTDTTMNGDNTAATAAASSITEYSSPALRSSRREPSLNTANRSAFQSNGTRTTTNGATPARSIWVPPNPQHKPLVAMRATGGIRFMDPPITEPLDNNAASDSREKRPLNSSSTTQSPKGRRRSEGIIRSSNENRICLPPQSNSRRMTVAGTSNAVTSVAPLHNAMLQHQSLIPPEPPQQRQIRARARATYGIWPVPCTRLPGRQLPESSHQDEQPSMEQPPNNAPKNESELQDEEERGVDIVDSAPPPVFDLQRYTFRVPRRIALAAETATDGPTDVRLRKFTNLPLLTASPPIEDDNVQRWVSLQEEEAGLAKQRAANEKEERRFRAIQKSNDAAGEGMSETTKQVEGFDKLALSWGKGFGTVAAGSWRCASCDIVNNGTDNKCVSCTADRPNDDLANTNGLEGSTVGTATASTTTQTLTSSANPESRFSFGGTPAPSTVAGSGFTFGGTPAPSTVSGGGFTFSAAPAPSTVPGGSFTFSAAPAPSSNASTSFTGGVNASSTIMVATRTSAPPATAGGMSFMSTQASTLGSTFSFGANNASHGNSAEEKNQEEAKLHPDEVEDALPSVSEPSVGASSATAVPTLTSHGNTASASAPFSFSTGVTRTEAPAPFSAATASKIKVKFSSDPDDGGIEVKKFRGPEDGGNNGVPDQHPPSGGHVGSSTGSSGATWTNANNTAAPTAPFFRFVGTSAPTQAPALTPNDMGTSHSVSMLGSSAASGPRDGTSQPFAFGASANNAEALAPPPAFGSNQATSFAAPSFGGAPPSAPASTAAPSMFSAPTQATSQIGFGSSAASAHATTGALNFSSAPSPAQGALMFGATPASAPPAPFSFPAPAPFSSSIAPALPAAFSSSAPIPSSSGFGSSVPAAFGLAPAAASTGFGLPTPAVPTVFGPAAPFPSPPTFGGFGSSAPTPAVSNFGSAPAPVPNAFSGPGSASTLFGSSAAVSDQGMSGFMQGADVAAFGGNASAPPGDGGFQVGTAATTRRKVVRARRPTRPS